VNVIDPEPPEGVAKLYMTNAEWRRFVFSMIAEASAVVLVLPAEGAALTRGVVDELQAVDRLGRTADSVVVLADAAGTFSGAAVDGMTRLMVGPDIPALGASLSSAEALRGRGFAAVLREEEIAANPQLLIEAVQARLAGEGYLRS